MTTVKSGDKKAKTASKWSLKTRFKSTMCSKTFGYSKYVYTWPKNDDLGTIQIIRQKNMGLENSQFW